jgi:hypothetical protein
MIKPPFTLLILKDSHHPVTVRVSILLLILVCAGVPLVSVLAGFGLARVIETVHKTGGIPARNLSAVPARPDSGEANSPARPAEITGLFVSFTKDGGMNAKFSIDGTVPGERTYIWVIVNPDSPSSAETLIFPRSPMFRNLPLDFRNGFVHDPGRERTVEIDIPDGLSGVRVEALRILAYSGEGTLVADNRFGINPNAGK